MEDGSLRRLSEAEQASMQPSRLTFSQGVQKLLAQERYSATAVIERMKEAIGIANDADLAWIMGASQQSLWNRKNRNSVPYREAVFVAYFWECSLTYLLTGEGKLREDGHKYQFNDVSLDDI